MDSNDIGVAGDPGVARSEPLRAEALTRVADLLGGATDPGIIAEKIAGEAAELCGTRMASIFLFGDEGELEGSASVGLNTHFVREVEKLARTDWAPKYLAGSNKPFVIPISRGPNQPSPIHKLIALEGLDQILSIPLHYSDKLLGLIIAYQADKREYSRQDFDCLRTFAFVVSLALANTRLIETRIWEHRAQNQFLDALSHELRTPLTSIMGFTQMIRRRLKDARDVDARLRDQLDLLWAQSQRLNRLLDTFIDISNIERGEFALDHAPINLTELVATSVEQSRAQMRSRSEIHLNLPGKEIFLHGDARRLSHVFVHIISNAIRYSQNAEPITVICQDYERQKEVEITVTDHGPGIPSEVRSDVFKRSYPSETRKSGGMGLGLYASKAIVEAHGGRLLLDSASGQGTTVRILLPLD